MGEGVVEAKEDIKHLTKIDCFAKWSILLCINCIKFLFVCLIDLILNVPSTIFQLNREGSSWVETVLS